MLKSKSFAKVALGAAIAGAVGYVVGVRSAPRSGDKTRKLRRNVGSNLESNLEDRLGALYIELSELISSVLGEEEKLDRRQREKFELSLATAKHSKDKIAMVLKAVKDGESNDRDLSISIKEAQKAIEHARSFLLKK